MKLRVILSLLICSLLLTACSGFVKNSTFSILFIDVGQGDAALVECDGRYMLIDGGKKSAGSKVYDVLVSKGVQKLDILAISHLHEDHIGGLEKALHYISKIGVVLSNAKESDSSPFHNLEHELTKIGSKIKIPKTGDKYELGRAVIEVIDVASSEENDSLVLLITYGKTRFLFTGDIGESAQRRIFQNYEDEYNKPYKIDLIKMPHHGGKTLIRFIDVFMPDYAIISVGQGNAYGHPYSETLGILDQADVKVFRTDKNGDILVKSNGKEVSVVPSR